MSDIANFSILNNSERPQSARKRCDRSSLRRAQHNRLAAFAASPHTVLGVLVTTEETGAEPKNLRARTAKEILAEESIEGYDCSRFENVSSDAEVPDLVDSSDEEKHQTKITTDCENSSDEGQRCVNQTQTFFISGSEDPASSKSVSILNSSEFAKRR